MIPRQVDAVVGSVHDGPGEADLAQAIADDLAAVGIPTELRSRSIGEYRRLVSEGRTVELRLGPGVTLAHREIIKVLRWV